MHRILSALVVIFVMSPILFVFSQPGPALAHERRKVGKYEVRVGFLEEPALVGQMNPIILVVTNTETNKPVEGLQQTIDAEITSGGKSMRVSLRPRSGQPGNYLGDVIPTRVGAYAVRFFGEIEGLKIDETFQSGPGTFSDVEGVGEIQFPDKVPDAAEMAALLKRSEAAAQDARNMAVLLGGAGIVFGAASIVLALASSRARRT